MAISDKTRKIVWGRSGNRCAICRIEMVIDATLVDDESIVGEECHIVSGRALGPRFKKDFPSELLDLAENLILLCRVHHKMVDDQCETYTAKLLLDLKISHERWVSIALSEEPQSSPIKVRRIAGSAPPYLVRLTSGQDVLNVVGGTCASLMSHVDPRSQEEAETIAGCLQEIQDWADLWTGMEAGERVRAAFALTNCLSALQDAGLWVFGAKEVQQVEGGNSPPAPWPVAHIDVTRAVD